MAMARDIIDPSTGRTLCNSTAIREAARHVTRFYDACLAGIGLRAAQYTMLLHLVRQGTVSVNELAEAMVMDRTTIAHSMKPLERDGLVRVSVNPQDRRSRLIALTEAGRMLVEEGFPAWEEAQGIFEREFGGENARSMRQTMAAIVKTNFSPK